MTQADRRDALVRRILDAALELFAEGGFAATSIPQVMEHADVGAGSLYRLFESKEVLVNAVYRDAKLKLQHALRDDLSATQPPRSLYNELWRRLTAFAKDEPLAFRFLELQNHAAYLDGESRQLELAVLAPIALACMDFQRRGIFRAEVSPEVVLATIWGAFVGLVKAERLGYLRLEPAVVDSCRDACWRAFAVDPNAVAADTKPAEK